MPNKMIAVIAFFLMTVAAFCAPPFEWEAKSAGNSLTVTARVAPGNYFYANSLILVVTGADGSAAAMTSSPEAVPHHDEFLGDVGIYPAGTHVWKFTGMPPFKATVNYQGCREKTAESPAMCFLPKKLDLTPAASPLAELEEKAAAVEVGKEEFKLDRKVIGLQNVPQFKAFLTGTDVGEAENSGFGADAGWLWIVLLTVLGGLGLNLTPCVLPMIPVNLAIIGADGADKMTGFRRGLAYGIGMAAAYGILGVAVILTGARFGELNASSWFNFAIAAVFVVLALAMFGLFNLDLSGKVNVKPSRIKGGKTVVALVMGAVAALLAGACVAPVVIAVLVLAAERFQGGNVLALGLPFLLGVGMALPWPLAGAGLGVLPKPGQFMVTVKYVFGGIILLAALYYGYTGYTLLPGEYSPEAEIARLKAGLATAREQNKPVLVDLWASWCKNCRSMEKNVLSDPEIKREMEKFVVVKFQAEDPGAPGIDGIMKKWDIPGLPAFVILSPQ